LRMLCREEEVEGEEDEEVEGEEDEEDEEQEGEEEARVLSEEEEAALPPAVGGAAIALDDAPIVVGAMQLLRAEWVPPSPRVPHAAAPSSRVGMCRSLLECDVDCHRRSHPFTLVQRVVRRYACRLSACAPASLLASLPGMDEPAAVHAAPSATHGLGLFASVELPAGALVALYPVDAMGFDDGASGEVLTCGSREDLAAITSSSHRLYLPHHGCDGVSVDAAPPHAKSVTDGWLAHLVNDGAYCADGADPLDYIRASMAAENCVLVPLGAAPLVGCVTVRRVAAGTELLSTYGAAFWCGLSSEAQDVSRAAETRRRRLAELEAGVLETAMAEHAPAGAALSLAFAGALADVAAS
jgi:hypothetical protein